MRGGFPPSSKVPLAGRRLNIEGIERLYSNYSLTMSSTETRLMKKGGEGGITPEVLILDPPFPAVNGKLTKLHIHRFTQGYWFALPMLERSGRVTALQA